MELHDTLTVAVKHGASDVHLKAGLPPMFRLNGRLIPLKEAPRVSPEEMNRLAASIMNDYQREHFRQYNELDLAYGIPGLGRFRVNVFQQRGTIGIVLRVIPFTIRSLKELSLPRILETISMEERGLVLVTGTTGSGKSSTMAAMVDHINCNKTVHVMTVEDPIEFLIRDKRSVINQREVGVDTASFGQALRSALRQDPDVILVGEMRDLETIQTALTAAETGHLVLSTLHTVDATETISRIVSVFPPHQQQQVRLQLGATLKAVVSQRLVPTKDKRGRLPALEILRNTPRIRELLEDAERTREVNDAIAEGHISYGMQTFDQSLMQHFREGRISYDEALRQAGNPSNFALRVQGIESASDGKWEGFDQQPGPEGAPGIRSRSQPKVDQHRSDLGGAVTPRSSRRRSVRTGDDVSRLAKDVPDEELPRGQTSVFLLPPEMRVKDFDDESITRVSPLAEASKRSLRTEDSGRKRRNTAAKRQPSWPGDLDSSDRDESL